MRNPLVRCFLTLSVFGALVSPASGASTYYKEVCASGCAYTSVKSALDSITDSSATKIYTIFIDSGVLQSASSVKTEGKSYINFVGRGAGVSVFQASPAWYSNVASGATTPDFLDLSGSTNITIASLSIDARSTDPGNVSTPTVMGGVKVDAGSGGKVLVEGSEIQGVTYGIWDGPVGGGLVEIFNSKIRAARYGVYSGGDKWHIYSSEIRVMDTGAISGPQPTETAAVRNYVGETVLWGSHIHAESSQDNQDYPVYGISSANSAGSSVTAIGSTVHVKMATTLIGSSSRFMNAAYIQLGLASFAGTEFLYESTGTLNQGRLSGLRITGSSTVNLGGCTFRDAGGSGGTSRSDLLIPPAAGPLQIAGTRVASLALFTGTTVPANVIKALSTAAAQRGPATFAGSGSVAVTLPVALPDANYNVSVSTTATETFSITGKTQTGFTINSSNPSSTATVVWFLN